MTTVKTTHDCRCVIFLKDEKDRSLLQPGQPLYGEFVRSTKTYFLTPYPPPSESLRQVATIEAHPRYDHSQPGTLVLSIQNQEFTAHAVLDGQAADFPVNIVFKASAYSRTPFDPYEMESLWDQTVVIMGLGTGGSKIAVELARAGVGKFKLCDPEKLDYANISRHEGPSCSRAVVPDQSGHNHRDIRREHIQSTPGRSTPDS